MAKCANGSAAKKHANGPSPMPFHKYNSFLSWYAIPFDDKWKERKWPSQRITQAPRWCSVDLRDGNQALANPMNHEKKLRFFLHLVKLGYKEIEVGFPSASQTEFDFCRYIIDNNLIPDDVYIQVMAPCREGPIKRTVESVAGAKKVIFHMYNSTSELQRRVVFGKSRAAIKQLAVEGAALVKRIADERLVPQGTEVRYEYSPESFTGTELDFALEVVEDVLAVLAPKPEDKLIVNVPATVEMATPNVYADQIEWMCAHFRDRSKVIVSAHPHNDRGCGVAAAELGVMAGADRVEGCLFGNGERTGNVCLVTLAMNLFTQGIDPEVDFSNIQESIEVAEHCNELTVPERYPWAGSLVYTAFSGSHQDAIKKGLAKMADNDDTWEVPYLPVDPKDIGRSYDALVRVNSQSGKGGIAYILEQDYGITLPKEAQAELSAVIQGITDTSGVEVTPARIFEVFQDCYLRQAGGPRLADFDVSTKLAALAELEKRGVTGLPKALQVELVGLCKPLKDPQDCYQAFRDNYVSVRTPVDLLEYEISGTSGVKISATLKVGGKRKLVTGEGSGAVDAYVRALNGLYGQRLELRSCEQRDLEGGAGAGHLCCVSVSRGAGPAMFGVGMGPNTTHAALSALTVAVNRAISTPESHELPVETLGPLRSIPPSVVHKGDAATVLGPGDDHPGLGA